MRIAIAGGIGSGKSEALKVAREMGAATLSADEINAELLLDADYILKISRAFPQAVVDGKVNRKALAQIVFSDEEARNKLNLIAHPLILKRIKEDMRSPLVVEMPLLIESGAAKLFDEIIFVKAPVLKRLKRLKRRGLAYGQAIMRMRAQTSEKRLAQIATRVLTNRGNIDGLRKSARATFEELFK